MAVVSGTIDPYLGSKFVPCSRGEIMNNTDEVLNISWIKGIATEFYKRP